MALIAVKRYMSTMTGAPVVTGATGSLITVLDAVLVNGFNTRTLTSLTRSGSTATGTFTAHGYNNNDILLISGANETEYNGEFRVFNATANTFDYTVTGTPATPATGTITAKIASLNWTIAFTGTNQRAYRPPNTGVSRPFLQVLDDGTTITVSGAAQAAVRGFQAMTSVTVGTDSFPTTTQVAASIFNWRKSTATDGTSRPWTIVGDDALVYVMIAPNTSNASTYEVNLFGDPTSYKTSDAFSGMIVGSASNTLSDTENIVARNGGFGTTLTAAVVTGHFMARKFDQSGTSIQWGKTGSNLSTSFGSTGTIVYPSIVDSGLLVGPIYVTESVSVVRGSLPGLFQPVQLSPLNNFDTVSVPFPDNTTRTVFVVSIGSPGPTATGRLVFDITGPWR